VAAGSEQQLGGDALMLFNLIATMHHGSLAPAVQQQLQTGGAEGA